MRLALQQDLLRPLGSRDVSGDLGCAYDFSVGIHDRRDRHGDINDFPVLAAAAGFEMLDPLSPADAVQNFLLLILLARRQKQGDRAPHDFLGAIAEDFLGRLVPIRHQAIQTLAYDGVIGRGDDGRKPGE